MNIINQEIRPKWALYNADCVEVVASLPDNSVGFSVFSPPFASLYTYSDSPRDMGNSRTYEEFAGHFAYLAADLFRVTKQGRLVSFHCANIPLMKERDGVIGLRDFRGDMIRWFQAAGFIYHSEVTIWKDPVIEMQRTKSLGLLHKQIKKDSCRSRMGNPDYVVTMRKDGENFEPVSHTNETFPVDQWQKWASPVWMDIDQGNTLSYMQARDSNDERHICPLQLDVIERCIELWSNPGDVVLSPFAGIGSEGYVAVTRGRRFIGVELKPSYYEVAVKNLRAAEMETERVSIFDIA
jgi:DNA modification methylase